MSLEVGDTGRECEQPGCGAFDVLPLYCSGCGGCFCTPHGPPDAHRCAADTQPSLEGPSAAGGVPPPLCAVCGAESCFLHRLHPDLAREIADERAAQLARRVRPGASPFAVQQAALQERARRLVWTVGPPSPTGLSLFAIVWAVAGGGSAQRLIVRRLRISHGASPRVVEAGLASIVAQELPSPSSSATLRVAAGAPPHLYVDPVRAAGASTYLSDYVKEAPPVLFLCCGSSPERLPPPSELAAALLLASRAPSGSDSVSESLPITEVSSPVKLTAPYRALLQHVGGLLAALAPPPPVTDASPPAPETTSPEPPAVAPLASSLTATYDDADAPVVTLERLLALPVAPGKARPAGGERVKGTASRLVVAVAVLRLPPQAGGRHDLGRAFCLAADSRWTCGRLMEAALEEGLSGRPKPNAWALALVEPLSEVPCRGLALCGIVGEVGITSGAVLLAVESRGAPPPTAAEVPQSLLGALAAAAHPNNRQRLAPKADIKVKKDCAVM